MLAKKFTNSMIDCCGGQQHRHNDVKVGYLRNLRNQERKTSGRKKYPRQTMRAHTYAVWRFSKLHPLEEEREKKNGTLLSCNLGPTPARHLLSLSISLYLFSPHTKDKESRSLDPIAMAPITISQRSDFFFFLLSH